MYVKIARVILEGKPIMFAALMDYDNEIILSWQYQESLDSKDELNKIAYYRDNKLVCMLNRDLINHVEYVQGDIE